jgi:hypothetical protein
VKHALVVPFPEVEEVAVPWLEHSIGARPSQGIPPHVTLLFPSPGEPVEIGDVLADVDCFPRSSTSRRNPRSRSSS